MRAMAIGPSSSPVNAQYCNGSRVPPENGGHGYLSPPGRSETTGLSTLFVFNNITPAATVDRREHWINLSYGPLALFNNAGSRWWPPGRTQVIAGAYSIGRRFQCGQRGHQQRCNRHWISSGNPRPAAQGNAADIGAVGSSSPATSTDRPWSR